MPDLFFVDLFFLQCDLVPMASYTTYTSSRFDDGMQMLRCRVARQRDIPSSVTPREATDVFTGSRQRSAIEGCNGSAGQGACGGRDECVYAYGVPHEAVQDILKRRRQEEHL